MEIVLFCNANGLCSIDVAKEVKTIYLKCLTPIENLGHRVYRQLIRCNTRNPTTKEV
jgi:hypothetical protein